MILFPKFLLELGLPSKASKNVVGGNPVLLLSSRSARKSRIGDEPCEIWNSNPLLSPHVSIGRIANLRMRVLVNAGLRTGSILPVLAQKVGSGIPTPGVRNPT